MDVFEAIQQRRSIRAYLDKPVPQDKLLRILEAARLAPSAVNREPWHFIAVTNPEKRKALAKGMFAKFLAQTPLVIAACGDKKASPEWYIFDTALAVENIILNAVNEGLGTCCVGSFDEKQVATLLGIPDNLEVLLLIGVGYPKEKLDLSRKVMHIVRKRKILSEVASFDEYGKEPTLEQV
jgi:nitroreductase